MCLRFVIHFFLPNSYQDLFIRSYYQWFGTASVTPEGTANVICDESVATGAPVRMQGSFKEGKLRTSHRVTTFS